MAQNYIAQKMFAQIFFSLKFFLPSITSQNCQNPNTTLLNLKLGLTRLLLFTTTPPTTRNSTSIRNKGPSGLKFCMRPLLTKLTTTQHNFNPTIFWVGVEGGSYILPLGLTLLALFLDKIFLTKNLFDQKFFLTKNFFDPKNSLTKNIF